MNGPRSAYGDMNNIRVAMNRGAFDFLTKPIDFTDLVKTIDKTLRHVEMMREYRRRQIQAERAHASLSRYFSPQLARRLAAHLPASPQGLWDLSCRGDFRQQPLNPPPVGTPPTVTSEIMSSTTGYLVEFAHPVVARGRAAYPRPSRPGHGHSQDR